MKHINNIDNLLARHFCNENLTIEQEKELKSWILFNKKEYERLEGYFKEDNFTANSAFDSEKAWKTVETKLLLQTNTKKRRITLYLAYAASVLLILSLALFYSLKPKISTFAYDNTGLTNKNIMLPDSTSVLLFSNSKIIYKANKNRGQRKLALVGKALFNVKKDKDRPFIVKAYNINVEVLGTTFLVDAISVDLASVYVKTGLVKVSANSKQILLKEKQKLELRKDKIIKGEITNIDNIFEPIPTILVFENASIDQVVRQIEKHFYVHIDLGQSVKQKRITSKLKMENLSNILLELCYVCDCSCDTLSSNHYKLF